MISHPHGGYPTPDYNEVPFRRRAESLKLFGHTGAHVSHAVRTELHAAAYGEVPNTSDRLGDLISDAAAQRVNDALVERSVYGDTVVQDYVCTYPNCVCVGVCNPSAIVGREVPVPNQ